VGADVPFVPPEAIGRVPVVKADVEVAYTAPPEVNVLRFVPPLAVGRTPDTPVVNGRAVPFVRTTALGVPKFGVTKTGFVDKTTDPVPVDVVTPVPPLATGRVPVTPVVSGNPVRLVATPLVGVPSKGVIKVGLVANATSPEPVSSVNAVRNWAEVNDPKEAALPTDVTIPVRLALVITVVAFPALVTPPVKLALVTTVVAFPTEVTPPVKLALVTTVAALPTDVTPPVKLALVVTLLAVKAVAVPVIFVPTRADGVPRAGVTRVGLVTLTKLPDPVPVYSARVE
jgi:hypothetical protein